MRNSIELIHKMSPSQTSPFSSYDVLYQTHKISSCYPLFFLSEFGYCMYTMYSKPNNLNNRFVSSSNLSELISIDLLVIVLSLL